MNNWSRGDELKLEKLWKQGLDDATIGLKLQRTAIAIRSRRKVLGLVSKTRKFTQPQLQIIRDMYADHTAQEIADRLGKTKAAIHRITCRLKLPPKVQFYPQHILDQVAKLHAEGLSDVEIGARMSLSRDKVHHLRYDRLSLPANEEAVKRAQQRAIRTQFARCGVKNRAELRKWAFRKYAREHGLPEELPPRCVQIVYALATHGPMTLVQICEAIGKRWRPGAKNNLFCNHPNSGGSYPAYLAKLGIIVHLRRKLSRPGKGQNVSLYNLTLEWRERITRHVQENARTAG